MPKTYLENIDFSEKASDTTCGAHIAYTFDFQGGAASGYNTALLFKSEDQNQVSFDKIEKLAALGEDVTDIKKTYINQLTDLLSTALNESYAGDWDWVSLVDADFDENIVIFCNNEGLFSTTFTLSDGNSVTVADTANPVIRVSDYQVTDDQVLISNDFFDDAISSALSTLTKNALKHAHVTELLIKASKNSVATEAKPKEESTSVKSKGDYPLDIQELFKSAEFQEQFQKALDEKAEVIKAAAKAEAEIEINKAKELAEKEIAELRKAAYDAEIESAEIVVKGYNFVAEEDVEVIVKHLVDNPEIAEVLLKTLDTAKEQLQVVKQELGSEQGISVQAELPKVAKSANEAIANRAKQLKEARASK